MNQKATTKSAKETQAQEIDEKDNLNRIIAIGASAGGLEALKEFFNHVPHDCQHSFIIIQHLSPDYKSLMAELLAKNTVLPIYEVKNNMVVQPGMVYLIPPKKNMTIMNGKLHLVNKPKGHDLNLPIDIFFRSLAQEYREKAICIVLSGTGSDGTSGARAIKEAGGMVMVQDPDQAKFDGMPRSAINTGLVDYTLSVESMAGELLHHIEHATDNDDSVIQIEEDEDTISAILKALRTETTLDFEMYKRPTLVRRIARRISVNKLHNQREYLEFLRGNSAESSILAREFLIGVTNFFRDAYVWDKLESKIIPELVASKKKNDTLKVWCVGASTGEEAYSMAMLISEEVHRQDKNLQIKVFATDLASNHLDIGSKGLYPESIVANVSPNRLRRFFTRRGDEYQVNDSLRKMMIFSQHNILKDPPFNKMDISVCRNLLIYMQQPAQRKVMGLLHYSLNLNGTLVLGSSESLGDYSSVLKEIDRKSKIFRNVQSAKGIGLEPLSYPDTQKIASFNNLSSSKSRTETKMADVMNETVAEELGLAGVYIDEAYNILHAIGEFKKFVELPDKGFSINLLKMLPPSISISLAAAVRKAFTKNQRVLHKTITLGGTAKGVPFDLLVNPFEMNNINRSNGCLLLFIPKKETQGKAKLVMDTTGASNVRILELEEELNDARDSLNNVIEEVETSNEELQATNEELLAANEELQSTNEELQSVNEELHSVNAELQQKIEDLAALNGDMDNLLKSTDIGTIFLDTDMRIRKFTPSISEHFHLRPTDIDRPISHFANSFGMSPNSTLERIQGVIDTGDMSSAELQSNSGKWFLMRITPYHDSENEIDGAVMSFVDIDEIKKSETIIKQSEEEFRQLYDNAPDMFASFDLNGNIINCNMRMVNDLGYEDSSELIGKPFTELYAESDLAGAHERLKIFKNTGKLSNTERKFKTKGGSTIPISANAQMLYDENGNDIYFICSFRDITALKIAEKKYIDKNNAFEQLLEGTMAGYWDWMVKENTEYLSPSFKKMFGYEDHEMDNSPEAWQKIIHQDDLPGVLDTFDKHVSSKGEIPYSNQVRYYHKDGSIVWIYCSGKIIEWDTEGNPVRMVGSHVDITPIKNIELELYRSNRELEQFAYVASHDLQEPLNTITDFVELLGEEYKGKLDADADKYMEFTIDAAARMRSLVQSVLSYSRIGRNSEKTKVDCNDILKDIEIDFKKRFEETKTKLSYEKLPIVKGNVTELHSLFQNLISNAVKFRREGCPPKINITVQELDTHWKFSIKDNGIGIAKNNRKRVFNIFQRLNNMDSYEGTGIGLAQCKKIVELHDGEIYIEGTSKLGTKFNFTLKK